MTTSNRLSRPEIIPSPLIDACELAARLDEIVVIDASWVYPPFNTAGIDVRHSYCVRHIPGSWFLDLASLSQSVSLADPRIPALMRPPRTLVQALLAGLVPSLQWPIVVTDSDGGCTSAPFARWLLEDAGYGNVRLLGGGTPSWSLQNGLALTHAEPRLLELGNRPSTAPQATEPSPWFASFEHVVQVIEGARDDQLLDCRAFASNRGVLPEDYEAAEIPCACTARSSEVVEETAYGLRFRQPDELAALFAARGVDPQRSKITTCYFGVGAAVVATALEIAHYAPASVYAGSIVDYAQRNGLCCARTG
jgi:thiosulfate/3-mercaptopyruvate sulfurtransferase